MKVAIIGATGKMGMAIGQNLAKAGHELCLYGHHADALHESLKTLKAVGPHIVVRAMESAEKAVAEAEVTIVALWRHQQQEFIEHVGQAAAGKIVVSIANPFDMKTGGSAIPENTSVAEELAALLPTSKIVKAFNTAFAADYQDPKFDGVQADMFVAADDESAVKTVSMLVKDAGFNPVFAGKLIAARTMEQMMILLGGIAGREKYNWVAGWKVLHR